MKYSQSLILPLVLLAGAQPAAASTTQELVWRPSPDQKLRREIVSKHSLIAESQTSAQGGEQAVSQRRFDLESMQRLTVTDAILGSEKGKLTRVSREYGVADFEATTETSAGKQRTRDDKLKGASPMVGTSVMFTWIPEDGNFGRYYDKKEGTEEILPGLTVDLGLGDLMPREPVQLGSTWKLEPGVLKGLFSCGGDTNMSLANDVGEYSFRIMRLGTGLDLDLLFGDSEKGTVTARWTGTEEDQQGRKLALIQLEFDVEIQRDMKDRANGSMMLMDRAAGFQVDSALVTLELKGQGVVRWDMTSGHMHDTQNLKAEERIRTKLVQVRESGDQSQFNTEELVMIGHLNHSIVVTEVN